MQALLRSFVMVCATALANAAELPAELSDRSTNLSISYVGQAAANPSGGLRQDSEYAGRIVVRAHVDLGSTLGLGGELNATLTSRHGDELSATAIGNNTSVQEIYGPQRTSLGLLAYSHTYLDRRLELEVGRLVANTAFLNSPLYCHFQSNAVCPSPTFIFKTSNFTFFPAPSWGAHIKAWLTGRWYFHAGAYEVNPEQKRRTADGLDWSTSAATGIVVPYELGYAAGENEQLARHYRFGGWLDTGDYTDPSRDELGTLAALSGRPYATRTGRSGVFVQLEQSLLPRDLVSNRGLTTFAIAMATTAGRSVEDRFFAIGLVQQGTFRGRDEDTVAFVVSEQRFSKWAIENGRAARSQAGGAGDPPHRQRILELAYSIQLMPRVRISPNIQYIVHPDQTSYPFRVRDTPDALVLGFKLTLDNLVRFRGEFH
jgi:porin